MGIQKWRKAIDVLDAIIVDTLSMRMEISMHVAALKAEEGLPQRDLRREAFILSRVRKLAKPPLTGKAAAEVTAKILEVTRAATKAAVEKGKYEKRA